MAVRKDSSSEEDEEMILDEFVHNVVHTLSRILSLHLLSMYGDGLDIGNACKLRRVD